MSYKKIVLHPLDDKGQPNPGISLFPDTLSSSLLKSDGETPFVPAEKEVVEAALSNKLDKIEGGSIVYVTSENGVNTEIKWSESAEAKTIARRNASGGIIVPMVPQELSEAASKNYVDDAIDGIGAVTPEEVTEQVNALRNEVEENYYTKSASNSRFSVKSEDENISGAKTFQKTITTKNIVPSDDGESHLGNGTHRYETVYTFGISDGVVTKQVSEIGDKIDAEHKLNADFIDDTSSTKKLVTSLEKTTWNAKQNALTFDDVPTLGSTNPVTSDGVRTAINTSQSAALKFQGTKTVIELNGLTVASFMNGYMYNVANDGTLTVGNVSVKTGDNVVIVWDTEHNTFSWDKMASTIVIDPNTYVPTTRKIAGISLAHNIGATELSDALNLMDTTTDVSYIMGDE